MKISALMILLLLICICTTQVQGNELIGGKTLKEWGETCTRYFKQSGDTNDEKAFLVPGYCEQYMCQKYGKDSYGMRIDECDSKSVDGKPCKLIATKNKLPYPKCCMYKC